MTLFRREKRSAVNSDATYNPFDNPGLSLASLIHASGNSPGSIAPQEAIGLPTAYRCISIIASTIAAAPLELTRSLDAQGQPWTPWQNLVSYTPYEINELMVTHLAGWGNFFAFKVMAPGYPSRLLDLQPIHPSRVTVRLVRGEKTFLITPDPLDEKDSGQLQVIPESAGVVFHIPFMGHDGLKGISPIMWAATTFSTAMAADALSLRFHTNGQHIQGIVKIPTPLADQEDAEAIKRHWQTANGGVNGAGGVAVLDSGAEFTPLTLDPDALQLLESRNWSMQEVARVFGLPLTMLSSETTGYGDAIATQMEGFVTLTLRGYTDRIEQRLAREFTPRGSDLQFNLDHVLRGNPNDRYATWNLAIAGGWMTPNEVREQEDMEPLPGLNEPMEVTAMNGMMQTPTLSLGGGSGDVAQMPQASDDGTAQGEDEEPDDES